MVKTGSFWVAFGQTVRGWAIGLGLATALAVPIGIALGSSEFAARGLPRADRVPAPDPLRGADPASLPDARHEPEERDLPRDVRGVLAAARADDVRRPRRRPARPRHRPLVRGDPAGAPLPDHPAERAPLHRDRHPHLLDGGADPGLHRGAVHGHAGARTAAELRAGVRPDRPRSTRSRSRPASSASRSTSPWPRRASRPALAPVPAVEGAREPAAPTARCDRGRDRRAARDPRRLAALDRACGRPEVPAARRRSSSSSASSGSSPSSARTSSRASSASCSASRIAVVVGIGLGIPIGLSRWARLWAMPHIEYWRAMPAARADPDLDRPAALDRQHRRRSRSSRSSASSRSC